MSPTILSFLLLLTIVVPGTAQVGPPENQRSDSLLRHTLRALRDSQMARVVTISPSSRWQGRATEHSDTLLVLAADRSRATIPASAIDSAGGLLGVVAGGFIGAFVGAAIPRWERRWPAR